MGRKTGLNRGAERRAASPRRVALAGLGPSAVFCLTAALVAALWAPAIVSHTRDYAPAGARLRVRLALHAASRATFAPTPGVTESPNWAGYVDVAQRRHSFTRVSAQVVVPRALCRDPHNGDKYGNDASTWVGFDGWSYSADSVEQVGIDSYCNRHTPAYDAWYEDYPKPPVFLHVPVRAGDSLRLSVAYHDGVYTVRVQDITEGWTRARSFVCAAAGSCPRSSAEVLVEDPGAAPASDLTDYGLVTFNGAQASTEDAITSGLGLAYAGHWSAQVTQMADINNNLMAVPCCLGALGKSFSVRWDAWN